MHATVYLLPGIFSFLSQPVETDGTKKELKKFGLINSFFQPIKSKEDVKSKTGTEIPLNCNDDDICIRKTSTVVAQEPDKSGSLDDESSNKKTVKLSEKGEHSTPGDFQDSSKKESVKSKQVKPKWSVTCAVHNSSKDLSSSGSEFEDEGKSVFSTKTTQAQKKSKKKTKSESGTKIISGTQETEGKLTAEFVGDLEKESKSVSKARESIKKKEKTESDSHMISGFQDSEGKCSVEFIDDFEENKSASKANRSGKKKQKSKTDSEMISGVHETEGKLSAKFVDDLGKESKPVSKTRKLVKKKKNGSGSESNSGTQESNENTTECVDIEKKTSKSVRKSQAQKSDKTSGSILVFGEKSEQLNAKKVVPDMETKDSLRCENTKEPRTSAFDVLMKSQRVQKVEDLRTENSLNESGAGTVEMSSDNPSDTSCSCEVVDVEDKAQSKSNVTFQSKSPSSTDKSSPGSSTCRTASISRTNAFDFLMKKGRIGKSGVDSQVESEIECEVSENVEAPLKKRTKKKSFEFQLSIRASNKKDIEFSLASESVSSAGDDCQDKDQMKSKKKTRKRKKNKSELAEGGSGESFASEKCKDKEVSKSKRGRKKSLVEIKGNTEEDTADVSVIEVNSEEAKKKGGKVRRKSGRKSASSAEVITADVNPNKALDDEDFKTPTRITRKKAKPVRTDEENLVEIKDSKMRKKRKSKKSDEEFSTQQLSPAESKQFSARYSAYLFINCAVP